MSGATDSAHGAGAGSFDLLRRATQAMMSRYAALNFPSPSPPDSQFLTALPWGPPLLCFQQISPLLPAVLSLLGGFPFWLLLQRPAFFWDTTLRNPPLTPVFPPVLYP